MDAGLAACHARFQAGDLKKAESGTRQYLRRKAGDPAALHLLGLIARKKGRIERAIQLLSKAAEAAPEAADILCDLGNAYKAAGRHGDAIVAHAKVVEIVPASPEAQSNLGAAYNAAGMPDEAVACFERAADARPGNAELLYNLGNGLLGAGRLAEAERTLALAVQTDPGHIRARTNLGVAHKEQGRLDEAIETFRGVIGHAPDNADAHWNLSLALIMAGRFRDGWREYEWRRRIPGFAMRDIEGQSWDGAKYPGKTLLIHAEQGFGDTIQFARYLPMAQDADGTLIFVCQQPLRQLLGGLAGGFEIRGAEEPLPQFDFHAPLMSLPHILDVAEPVWPVAGPYLGTELERALRWREKIGSEAGLKIGICWQGRPGYRADMRRSVPLEEFAPLAGIEGVRLISLQKGPGEEQLERQSWRGRVLAPGPELDALDADGPFLDSAAILGALDVLITSDTAIAHLAGALGVPVWLMLAHMPDWRWGCEGDRTPWYPSMRLFRQQLPGDWAGVISEITNQLGILKHA